MPTTIERRVGLNDVINVWTSTKGRPTSLVGIGFGPLSHYMTPQNARALADALRDAADAATAPLPVADAFEVE